MPNAVLMGDSILDNGLYVGTGEAVTDFLGQLLPGDWNIALLARDGSITGEVSAQLARRPRDASHLVVSCGGNDALGHLGILKAACSSVEQALAILAPLVSEFRLDYRAMLAETTATGLQLTVCTVYDAIPGLDRSVRLALALFNDVILREAIHYQVNVLDLRAVATEPADYAAVSPIEPSAAGARKIAGAIAAMLLAPTDAATTRIFSG